MDAFVSETVFDEEKKRIWFILTHTLNSHRGTLFTTAGRPNSHKHPLSLCHTHARNETILQPFSGMFESYKRSIAPSRAISHLFCSEASVIMKVWLALAADSITGRQNHRTHAWNVKMSRLLVDWWYSLGAASFCRVSGGGRVVTLPLDFTKSLTLHLHPRLHPLNFQYFGSFTF